jgi:hypothetical protein
MKKKTALLLVAFGVILGGLFIIRSVRQSRSDLIIESMVEALSLTEGEPGTGQCWKSITSSEGEFVLYCNTCTWLPGRHAFLSGKGDC